MTLNMIALILGLFGIPIALLVFGKRLRKRSSRVQKAFWGAAAGHVIATVVAMTAGFVSAESWTTVDRVRGIAGYWALLILPVAGALVGTMLARRLPPAVSDPRVRIATGTESLLSR